ncbi:IS1634 family transposase [Mycobacterium heckeshornense]|uniref:IS1634 family transposase n=1 Tax=Mycobacterium heckeshornense TaxID=110505 RepID=UPI000C19CC60
MHVARTPSKYVDKAGNVRRYESVLVRRTYRDGKKVRHETLANLSKLPADVIAAVEGTLKGQVLVPAGSEFTITRSLPHGDVAAVAAMARQLAFPALLGPACRSRDLVFALIISRVIQPASKLSTLASWADSTVGVDLDVATASTDEIYAAMDWLADRQDTIEKKLAAKHLGPQANPSRMALFDLTSAWMTGRCCELASRGYSMDGKTGLPQMEYGILTDQAGRLVAVRVFAGNNADPVAFTDIVEVVRTQFGLDRLVLVGDRGMITSARIDAIRELNDNPDTATGFGWLTALRAPQIAVLAADDGPLQMSLFDTQDLAEITHPDYPGERLIACRNPALAAQRARKRAALLAATEIDLGAIAERVAAGRLTGAGRIGEAVGKIIDKYKMGKHFERTITDTSLTYHRNQAGIDTETALDGIYVLRTSVPATDLNAPGVVVGYKNLAHVERDFRSIKTDDLDLRPIRHRLTERVKAHVLICMLACYVTWHLRQAWAPLTFTDEHPPLRDNPVAPAQRSQAAQTKAATRHAPDGTALRSFRGLLTHLATLTRNDIRYHGTNTTVPTLAESTPEQRRAFELIKTPIPLQVA